MEALQIFLCRDAVAFPVMWTLWLAQLYGHCIWLSSGGTVLGSVIGAQCLAQLYGLVAGCNETEIGSVIG